MMELSDKSEFRITYGMLKEMFRQCGYHIIACDFDKKTGMWKWELRPINGGDVIKNERFKSN